MNNDPNITTRRGKIAALPLAVREELNRRLDDGQSRKQILPWLNALPEVIKRVAEDFEGIRISDANLTAWRQTGYETWVKRRDRVAQTRDLAAAAAQFTRAAGASISQGAQAIASGQILELLEMVQEATDREGKRLPTEELVAIVGALANLRTSEQNDVRLKQNDKRLAQKDEEIALDRQRLQYAEATRALKILKDDRARQIEAGEGDNSAKIEALGQLMFGDTWQPAGAAHLTAENAKNTKNKK